MLNSNISGEMAQLMIRNQTKYVPVYDINGTIEVLKPVFF